MNGFMIDGVLSDEITSGKKANTALSIWKSDLEENNIVTVKELETVFFVMDNDTWDDLFVTDTIMIYTAE